MRHQARLMSVRIALTHRSIYRFNREISLAPHEVRLKPMPGGAIIDHYQLDIFPAKHDRYWYFDAQGNHVARLFFPLPAQELRVIVSLEATLSAFNPFSFLVEDYAQSFPFDYSPVLRKDLSPCLEAAACGPLCETLIATLCTHAAKSSLQVLIELNRAVYDRVEYLVREEAGVQTPEETLAAGQGSCRDSAWLFINLARHLGFAARYVSGYQIQLNDGQARQNAELHAWGQIYLPGAGWIGFDPTLGLLTAENHIPLAVATSVEGAAPIVGRHEACEVDTCFEIEIEKR
jgi:transglutaminase-like putative cysteine protease